MFRIGEFSRLGRVTVKTLHHYDEVGLLRPARVDAQSGYRWYSAAQLPRLQHIVALKALGFSLDQIALAVEEDAAERMVRLLAQRQAELEQAVAQEQARLVQVRTMLQRVTEEQRMSEFLVTEKSLPAMLVAGQRGSFPELGEMFAAVGAHVRAQGAAEAGPGAIICHEGSEYQEGGQNTEAVIPIATLIQPTKQIQVYELPREELAVCVTTTGPHDEHIDRAHQAIANWIEQHNYRMKGTKRIVFLHCDDNAADTETVVEIQYPVERA